MKNTPNTTTDLFGRKFGRLTVIKRDGSKCNHANWRVRCDSGNEKTVISANLLSGATQSCGCLAKEILRKRSTKHGLYHHPLYKVWKSMRDRCRRPTNIYYGARGIKVCKRWEYSFEAFSLDMLASYKPGLTLERKDTNGHYNSKNCCWATPQSQANNRRTNLLIKTPKGQMTLAQAARHYALKPRTLRERINRGYPVDKLFCPARKWNAQGTRA